MLSIQKYAAAGALVGALLLTACGSSSSSHSVGAAPGGSTGAAPGGSTASTSSASQTSATTSSQGSSALSADATSAATGDIPDNQVFLVFTNAAARYSIKYPEGWTQSGAGRDVIFRDKNNLVHIAIASGAPPTPASVSAQLGTLKSSDPTLTFTAPTIVTIGANRVVKAVYTTKSQPNPVTGKRVTLVVDRYELGHAGRIATVDLGTPKGVDNVDAYRMMIESFHWR